MLTNSINDKVSYLNIHNSKIIKNERNKVRWTHKHFSRIRKWKNHQYYFLMENIMTLFTSPKAQ